MFSKPKPATYDCAVCGKLFARKENLDKHVLKHASTSHHHCVKCGISFTNAKSLEEHSIIHQIGGKRRNTETAASPTPKRLRENPKEFYTLNKIKTTNMPKFNTTNTVYRVAVQDLEVRGLKDILTALQSLLSSIIDDVTEFAADEDLIRLAIQTPELDFPIQIPMMRKDLMTPETILSEIERVLQSFEQFLLDDTFEIDIMHVKLPRGGIYAKNPIDLEEFLSSKKCIIRIKNTDELCCARAIVTAKARLDKDPAYLNICQGRTDQTKRARELHSHAGVPHGQCGIDEVKRYQAVMVGYQIHLVSREHFNAIIYKGPEADKKIYLYLHNSHFDVITSMSAFLNRSYYCVTCQKGYNTKEAHVCNLACSMCRKIHPKEKNGRWITCDKCYRSFIGENCFKLHKENNKAGKSECMTREVCTNCDQLINLSLHKNKHKCGEVYCKTCKDFYAFDHKCYMQPATADDNTETFKYIFFDFECMQDDMIQCESGFTKDLTTGKCVNCRKSTCGSLQHVPNCCVAQKVCEKCVDEDISTICDSCGKREVVFTGPSTTESFGKWLFTKQNKGSIVFCHNFKGYDSYPILKYLYANATIPDIIPCGSKNMSIHVPGYNIKFLDSLNFIPTALKNLPKMFDLHELQKGWFPHRFNTRRNQAAKLTQLPDIDLYEPNSMKSSDRESFTLWYTENSHCQFDMQHELVTYCKSDVDILRKACIKFRELFIKMTDGVNPFENSITIASACMKVFRRNYLKEATIALIPAQGYNPEEKQSAIARQWLEWTSHSENLDIRHAFNRGEISVGNYQLDGTYELEDGKKVALEFHGDFWHGCPKCYARATVNTVNGKTMGELHQATIRKQQIIETQGYVYRCIWECEWKKQVASNPEIASFVQNMNTKPPLNPRDAFNGGRTETFKLYHEATASDEISYVDYTSLYPYINKYTKTVLGHPKRIFKEFLPIAQYEGLIKCTVLPPRGLLIPLLQDNSTKKLLFSLCRTCAHTKQAVCNHVDAERAFEGTWTTDEIKKALTLGYIVQNIQEVWHFEEVEQYNPETKEGGLFTQYINTFLKLKQEASGWPIDVETEDDKRKYLERYHEREGVQLEYTKIEKNPGLRALAKLMLNSFWGKFGQRSNMTKLEHTTDPATYFDLLTSDSQEVTDINFVSEDMVEMRWKFKSEFVETNARTNVVIAAYTTAQARLKLYEDLEKLGERAMYADTDSIIYTSKKHEEKLKIGNYLGELTDEVPHGQITHFVSAGPKNYAMKIETAAGIETMTKVRGITLNYKTALKLDFSTVKHIIDFPEDVVTTENTVIRRQAKDKMLLTSHENKDYKLVFDKRVITDSYGTLPYGF